jgi:hypothetical protein
MMWTPDPDLLSATLEAFREHCASATRGSAEEQEEALAAALEAAGTLVLLDRAGALQTDPKLVARMTDAARSERFDALGDAAFDVLVAVERFSSSGDPIDDEASARVRAALSVRDAIELRLVGAEAVLGRALDLDDDQRSSLDSFEELVRGSAWRLTALNDERAAALAWMAPAFRKRFWWWSEAVTVARDALSNLAAVADLVASSAEARALFEAHVDVALATRRMSSVAVDVDLTPLEAGPAFPNGLVVTKDIPAMGRAYRLELLRVDTTKKERSLHVALRDVAGAAIGDLEARLEDEVEWRPAVTTDGAAKIAIPIADVTALHLELRSRSVHLDARVRVVLASAPTVRELDEYVSEGRWRSLIERHAANDTKFADTLRTKIGAAIGKQPVGLVARIWSGKKTSGGPPRVPIDEATALAAAGEDTGTPRVVRLGELSPLQAEAQLVLKSRSVELRIYGEPGAIVSASLGGVFARPEEDVERWRAVVEDPRWPLELRIEGAGGIVHHALLDVRGSG